MKKKDVEFFLGDSVRIETDENVVWDFDGEEGIRGNVQIEVLKGHVKMFVPKNKKI